MRLPNEMLDHGFSRVEIGNNAAAQRPYRANITGRTSHHLASLLADSEHAAFPPLLDDRHNGGFIQHDVATAHIDQRVGRTEVDGDVFRQGAEETRKHDRTRLRRSKLAAFIPGLAATRDTKLYVRAGGCGSP